MPLTAFAQNSLRIPFEYENDFIIVSVNINRAGPVDLLFDTGSEFTILTEPLLFGILDDERIDPVRLVGSDLASAVTGELSRKNRLRVGDLDISGQPIIAVDSKFLDLTEMVGRDVYGIMGIGAFGAYVVEIDYAERLITLLLPEHFRPPRRGLEVPLRVHHTKPYVSLWTRIHPGFVDSLLFLIDTGAALEAMVYANPEDSTLYPPQIVAGAIGHGLGGSLVGFVGRSDTLYVDGLPLTGIVTHFQIAGDSLLRESIIERNGVIGNRLLSRFDVAINYPQRVVHLVPRRRVTRPLPYDRSGLKVIDDGLDLGAVRVQFVAPNTPASEAGIRAGDLIRKFNGFPVRLLSSGEIQRRLRGRVGRKIHLQIVRDDLRSTIRFTLRELI